MCKGKIIITDKSVENILLLINYNNFVVQIKKDG